MSLKHILLWLILFSTLNAKEVAVVKSLKGSVEMKRNETTILLKQGDTLENGDLIMTKKQSSIGIIFDDGTRLALGSKSIIKIKEFMVDPAKNKYNVDLNMTKGKASFSSGKIGKLSPESVKFHIPEGIISIRGTQFLVEVK